MLTEWYNRGMSVIHGLGLGLLFFTTGVRKILNKPTLGELWIQQLKSFKKKMNQKINNHLCFTANQIRKYK